MKLIAVFILIKLKAKRENISNIQCGNLEIRLEYIWKGKKWMQCKTFFNYASSQRVLVENIKEFGFAIETNFSSHYFFDINLKSLSSLILYNYYYYILIRLISLIIKNSKKLATRRKPM